MKILVRNLAAATNKEKLISLFTPYGAIQSCNLVLDKETGKSKGFAFIEMPKAGEAKVAIQKLNGYKLAGNKIRVKKAEKKKETSDINPPQATTKAIKKTSETIQNNANNALNIYGTPKQSDSE